MAPSKVDQIVSLIRFEEDAGMANADDLSALDDLFPPATTTAPTQERGPIGFSVVFNPLTPNGLEAKDFPVNAGATLLSRDMSLQAVVRWDFDAQHTYGSPGTIIARGHGNSTVENMPYAIELYVVDYANRIGGVRFLWNTIAGALKTETGGSFKVNASYFILTCTRRWVSPTSVVLRYYANDQLLAEINSTDGDIGGGVDGTTTIGTRYTGAAYGAFLAGAIDEIAISDYEICLEEIQATWNRIGSYQADGYRQILALMPPGIPISDDPASRAQGDLMSLGVGMGFADGQIENLRENLMPDRAFGNVLRRWERITQQPPNQGDSLDVRRARVMGHLSSREGCTVPSVQQSLAIVLDCLPTDLQVIAFDNTIRDTFFTLATERWATTSIASDTNVDVTGNELRLRAFAARGNVYQWDPSTHPSGGVSALLPAEPPRGFGSPVNGCSIFTALDPHVLPAKSGGGIGADAGVVYWSQSGDSMLFFGLRNSNGFYQIGYQRYEHGIATDATWQVLATISLGLIYLRIAAHGAGIHADDETYELSWSTTDTAESSFTKHNVTWLRSMQLAGCYLRSPNAIAADADVRFPGADFAFRNTKGTRPYYWYVYRDPGLGGSPDFVGANRILQRMRHAFTYTYAVSSLSLLCDNPASVCDGGAMGTM